MSLEKLTTEARNPASDHIDQLSTLDLLDVINQEDARVTEAVGRELPNIAQAVDVIAARWREGGRLIYVGAGTSGRLGVLDAAECPPTFNTPPDRVLGLIAGGDRALRTAVEGAEDYESSGADDLRSVSITSLDVVVGIATSGRTPYVIGALKLARELGAYAIGFSCNEDPRLGAVSDLTITPIVGPEVISGSTRMKAGTATKLVLNMLTTGCMVRLGKTYGNLMVDLRATNEKLVDRSRRIVQTLTGLNDESAVDLLRSCDGDVKTAIVAQRRKLSPAAATQLLQDAGGHLRQALGGNSE